MANNIYDSVANTPASIGRDAAVVAPSDSNDLDSRTKVVWCTEGGTVVLQTLAGTTMPAINVSPGQILPVVPKRILAASTATLWAIF
jgi:hypothetical protein